MKFRKKNRFHSEVFTASMNDIMFFLMLFFLIISTTAVQNAIKMTLPRATSQITVKANVDVAIDEAGNYFIGGKATTIANLPDQLAKIASETPQATLKIFADKGVEFDYVVQVMNLANKYKMKVVVATKKQE